MISIHQMTADRAEVDRRQFILGGALLAASAAAWGLSPRAGPAMSKPAALARIIPETIGQYRTATAANLAVPPESEISKHLYDQVLTRIYAAPDAPPITLVIAYGGAQNSQLSIHRPEICYTWAGYQVGPARHVAIVGNVPPLASAAFLTATRGDNVEQIYFWMRIGDKFPTTPMREKIDLALANLQGRLPEGVLVRISMLSVESESALQKLSAFNHDLIASLGTEGRALLLGGESR
jgi:EpsI family protein